MVLDIALLAIGVVGLGMAGYMDIKTTEFPDWIPYGVIVLSLVARGLVGFVSNDFSSLISGGVTGLAFLAIGFGLYLAKQWGDGDAWLLAALGFSFPAPAIYGPLPFQAVLLLNFFFVSFAYLVIYSLALGFKKNIFASFNKELKRDYKGFVSLVAAFTLAVVFAAAYMSFVYLVPIGSMAQFLALPPLLLLILLFVKYGRYIEDNLFKRRVEARNLREGDVPATEKWRVLSKRELEKIKRRGGHVWIKEGVRLAPAFAIAFVLSYAFGNIMFALFGLSI